MPADKFIPLDLSAHYNYRLIYPDDDIKPDSGLDGAGISEASYFTLSKPVLLDNIPYIFKSKAGLDTVNCNAQEVTLPDAPFTKIHLLGFMFWGANHDFMQIKYRNGQTISAEIYFKDWANDYVFRDAKADKLKVKAVKRLHSCGNIDVPLYLYHCEYENQTGGKPNSLILPDNMYMYIFAATVER